MPVPAASRGYQGPARGREVGLAPHGVPGLAACCIAIARWHGLLQAKYSKGVLTIRVAVAGDVPALRDLIDASVRELHRDDYTPGQIEGSLRFVYGVDTRLIADGTYFVVEEDGMIAGCGGWSWRRTLFGGDQIAGREDSPLDPATEAAKIRAFFVHPRWTRRGIASMILEECERAAAEAGFTRLEMGATLTGVPFYKARGYVELGTIETPLPGVAPLRFLRMGKTLPPLHHVDIE